MNEKTLFTPVRTLVSVIEADEDGNLSMAFDRDIIQEMGWQPGDTLGWFIDENGVIVVRKVEVVESEEESNGQ